MEKTVTITSDQREELNNLVRMLPAILAGRVPDVENIAKGFKSRVAHQLLSLIMINFNQLGRGSAGIDGDKWEPLSPAYLAYGRRFGTGEHSQASIKKAAGLGKNNRLAPGDNKGLLTPEQLKQWRQFFSKAFRRYIHFLPEKQAKAKAAAKAWILIKQMGGRTKLEVFGNRQVQILVDTGRLAESLQPGELITSGIDAHYKPPAGKSAFDQVTEMESSRIVVGTNVEYAKYHHNGKGRRRRRLWPEQLPEIWWRKILEAAVSGIMEIHTLFSEGRTKL